MSSNTIQYYYRAGYNRLEGYYGEVYHWEDYGNRKVVDGRTDYYESGNEAIDAAVELAEDKGFEPCEME